MKILITGATGFVGGALTAHLREKGHEVLAHSRTQKEASSHAPLMMKWRSEPSWKVWI